MIGWYGKVLINVYLLYAVKHETQENNHLKWTIIKSLLAYAAKKKKKTYGWRYGLEDIGICDWNMRINIMCIPDSN